MVAESRPERMSARTRLRRAKPALTLAWLRLPLASGM